MDARDLGQTPLHSRSYFDPHGALGHNGSLRPGFLPHEGLSSFGLHHGGGPSYPMMNRRPSYGVASSSPSDAGAGLSLGHDGGPSSGMRSPLATTFSPSAMSPNWWSGQHFTPTGDFLPMSPMHWSGHEQDQLSQPHDSLGPMYHSAHHCGGPQANGYAPSSSQQQGNFSSSRVSSSHPANTLIHFPQSTCNSSIMKDDTSGWGFGAQHSLSHSPDADLGGLKSSSKRLKSSTVDPLISDSDLSSLKDKDLLDDVELFEKNISPIKGISKHTSGDNHQLLMNPYPSTLHKSPYAPYPKPPQTNPLYPSHISSPHISQQPVTQSKKHSARPANSSRAKQSATSEIEFQAKGMLSDHLKKNSGKSGGFSFNVEDFLCVRNSDADRHGFDTHLTDSGAIKKSRTEKDCQSVIQDSSDVALEKIESYNAAEYGLLNPSLQDPSSDAGKPSPLTDAEFAPSATLNQMNSHARDSLGKPRGKGGAVSQLASSPSLPQFHGMSSLKVDEMPCSFERMAAHENQMHEIDAIHQENSVYDKKETEDDDDGTDGDSDSCDLTIDQADGIDQEDASEDDDDDEKEDEESNNEEENEEEEEEDDDDQNITASSSQADHALLNSSTGYGNSSSSSSSSDDDDGSSHLTFDSGMNDSRSQCADSLTNSLCDDDGVSPSKSGKRKMDSKSGPSKRRRLAAEDLIRIPLSIGWKRQIRIRATPNNDGLRGDVYYFAPCQKKFRTYPEISRYLAKENITDLTLDNFSFSTKVYIGEFMEAGEGSSFQLLPDDEVNRRLTIEREKQQLRTEKSARKKERKRMHSELTKKAHEARAQERLERQAVLEASRQSKRRKAEDKLQEKFAKQAALEAAKQAKKERALFLSEQRRLAKERTKEQKQMEKMQRLENIRMEKERRLMSIQEARRMKKESVQNAKKEDAMKKAQDREFKRQQAVSMKAQEKEERKQQVLMIRALESQRKAEERERLREEKRMEKKLIRQKKLEHKKLERQIHRELKKPIEDMALNDAKPLPDYPRVKGLCIPGKAFADLTMVEEFVHCFGHVLEIDPDSDFPSLLELQSACLSESSNEDVLFNACHSLLSAALDDPGMPQVEAVTALGVALGDVDLTESNISEVLRLFINERSARDELCSALQQMPLQSLSPIQKASCLAFLVNELLCSRTICREIDNSLEHISNLRKDKWTMEGRLRKLKIDLKDKRAEERPTDEEKPKKNTKVSNDPNESQSSMNTSGAGIEETSNSESLMKDDEEDEDEEEEEEDDDEEKDESEDEDDDMAEEDVDGTENGDSDDNGEEDTDEDTDDDAEPATADAMEKKLTLLEKKHSKYRSKLFLASHTLRGVCMGQDRFKRWYYVLPHAGGVYVEGLESGTFQDDPRVVPATETELTTVKEDDRVPVKQQPRETMSPSTPTSLASALPAPRKNIAWFSVSSKAACGEGGARPAADSNRHLPAVVAPGVRLLNQDRSFLESLSQQLHCGGEPYSSGLGTGISTSGVGSHVTEIKDILPSYGDAQRHLLQSPTLDFNRLIEQDPQKAAILLELQSFDPAPIPQDMQCGWWRITDVAQLQATSKALHPRGIREKNLQKSLSRHLDYASSSCHKDRPAFTLSSTNDENGDGVKPTDQAPFEDIRFPQVAFAIDKGILSDVEDLEEKVFSASLQVKRWRLPLKVSTTISFDIGRAANGDAPKMNTALELAKSRLLALELGIERRYLKHPFKIEKSNIPGTVSGQAQEDMEKQPPPVLPEVTPGLLLWRDAVSSSQSTSQLAMCTAMLSDCIAWDKSIMKVFCIICRKGDNEQLLLLCDNCDRGCHTYCCVPKLASIPDEDWFCAECILMASGSDQCCVCSGSSSKRIKCGFCPRHYHMQCLEPPLHKTPRSPWACPVCKKAKTKTRIDAAKKKRKSKPPSADRSAVPLATSNSSSTPKAKGASSASTSSADSRQNRKDASKDSAPCQTMLAELERHDHAWPFLVPVNCKQFPEYYQIIKKPMDFHTIKLKLRDYTYKSKTEFASDARLVFQNCETFNEDDSEVGQAGKAMRKYFEKRWPEVLASQKSANRERTARAKRQEGGPSLAKQPNSKVQPPPYPPIALDATTAKKDIEMEEVSESASSAMSSGSEEEESSSSAASSSSEEEENGNNEPSQRDEDDDNEESEGELQIDMHQ